MVQTVRHKRISKFKSPMNDDDVFPNTLMEVYL